MPYVEARQLVTHPVSCIDCHDPNTCSSGHAARIHEGMRALRASEGVATTT